MKKEDCRFQFEWDYLGWETPEIRDCYNASQKDWNQTLMVKLNQTSASLCKSSLIGGGNKILINSALLPLFETLEYYNPNDDNIPKRGSWSRRTLCSRYVIEIDDWVEEDIIFLYNNTTNEELLSKEHLKDVLSDIPFDEYKKGLHGYVTIKNYTY
jgi:hypothetical protein